MTKPDYTQMSKSDLRAYVLAHREDLDALEALLNDPGSSIHHFPFAQTEEEWDQQGLQLKALLDSALNQPTSELLAWCDRPERSASRSCVDDCLYGRDR